VVREKTDRAMPMQPTIGFLTVSGNGYGGATIRDVRLAQALQRRGYRCVIYWLLGHTPSLLGGSLPSRQLCTGARFLRRRPLPVTDFLLRNLDLRSERARHRAEQSHPRMQARALANFCDVLASPGTGDRGLVRRLERLLMRDRVSHLAVGMGVLSELAAGVQARGRHAFRWHCMLQGDDLFFDFARDAEARRRAIGQLAARLRAAEIRPAACSGHYARGLETLLGLPSGFLDVLYPGIVLGPRLDRAEAQRIVGALIPGFDAARPLVTYLGRVDSEKGVDLLLLSLRLLRERGVAPQIVVAGRASFGEDYERYCRRLARHLDLPVHFTGAVADREREALYAASRCVVYPVIHLEGFGMVAAEAMAQGVPVVVPRRGGLIEAAGEDGRAGGLLFQPWDSADLARQIERLLTDDRLHAELAANARPLAARFDVDAVAARFLAAIDLPPLAAAA
jgi:glycosyltransferase involved in cell wall biosynthesis